MSDFDRIAVGLVLTLVESKFELGRVVATTAVLTWANQNGVDLAPYLARHAVGDWGEMTREDREQNESALASGEARLFSAYDTPAGRLWIITEWDRSVTTILTPEDY